MPDIKTIKTKDFLKYLQYAGCHFQRMTGDHAIFTKPGIYISLVVPVKDKELPHFVVRNNLKLLQISLEKFYQDLEKL